MSQNDECEKIRMSVHVWMLHARDFYREREILEWMTGEERVKACGRLSVEQRRANLATRWLCRTSLSRYASVEPKEWRFSKGPADKPRIESPAEHASIRFNLAHTNELIVCAVTRAGEVGIDVERFGADAGMIDEISPHFLSTAERHQLVALSEKDRERRFLEIWTSKEAYAKALGTGVAQFEDKTDIPDSWRMTLHQPTPQHIAAVAIERAIPVEWRFVDWL